MRNSTQSTTRLALGLAVLALLSAPAAAQGLFVDKTYGFKVKPIGGYESIPVSPTEKLMIAQWQGTRLLSSRRQRGSNSNLIAKRSPPGAWS